MKGLTFILIFTLSFCAAKVAGQCVTVRTITGPAQVCAGSINNGYITESGMTGYVWTISAGGTITAGAGTNSITVTWNTTGSQTISVNYTDTFGCIAPSPTIFNVQVNPLLPVSVSIGVSSNPICAGTSAIFTATPSNEGVTPVYQWQVNGSNVGTNSPAFTTSTLANNDVVTVLMTSSLTCVSGNPATSNPITMTVNTVLPASVSISASPSGAICAGISVTFTATPVNGGSPTYQWKVNGSNVGTNNPAFTTSTLANNDVVTVVMTSSLTCVTGNPTTSNPITMTVNPVLPASVSISASPSGAICAGISVTFTATPVNGGSPTYQWKVNGSNRGTNSPAFTSSALANNDVVTVVMTSSLNCVSGNPATSNPITMTVNPVLPASVSISASPSGAICTGSSVTFTATPVNGGVPSYQWKVNGSNRGTNSPTFTSTTLANNDFVTVALTSSLTCVSGNPATSNPITMTVSPILPVSVSISGSPSGAICAGSSVTFTATPVNGGIPSYQWKVNGSNRGTNSPTFTTNTLANNDIVTVVMTSSLTCVSGNPATSNSISTTVNPALTASISGGSSPICYNTSPGSFTANGGGGSGSYTYLWYKDLISTGVTTQTYSPGSLIASSTFYCAVTSSPCGTVNTSSITITVNANLTANISGGSSPICYNTSPGTFTANGAGGTGSYTYLWYKDLISTGVTAQTYTPGNLIATSAFYCAVTSGSCGTVNTSTITITVTPQPSASISYTGSIWCTTEGIQPVTLSGSSGGTYSAPAGLSINPVTGEITTTTSSAGTYIVTYTISGSGGCGVTTATTQVTISPIALAPVPGSITQPTCSIATGSVVLGGLPASGSWTIMRNPGSVTTTGTGTSIIIPSVPTGTYTFTVTNSAGCISPASPNVVINTQPASPTAPVQSTDCSLGFGLAMVTVTSPVGAGFTYSLDGGVYQISTLFNPVNNGSHYLSVTNALGCTTTGSLFTVTCGCINPPTVALSVTTGMTCGTTPVTVTGNTFGGSATNVSIAHNGAGSVIPVSATVSPFQFTYTPDVADGGKTVIITVTTNNPVGGLCLPGIATYTLTVNAMPDAPIIGTITNLTCTQGTGSADLNGLPSTGTWSLTRNPGAIITSGSGTSTTVSGLSAGTYNFSVTSSEGCVSSVSADAVVNPAPAAPSAPVVGTITQPTCAISTGSVVLSGLPATGTWILTRSPGGLEISGSGASNTVSTIPSGTFTFTVTNSTGCTSLPSGSVLINTQPPIPAAPTVGSITTPTCTLSIGSVLLTGLPPSGTWTLIRYPGTVTSTGTGASSTLTSLVSGTYNYTVTTESGCLSVASANVVIPAQPPTPAAPVIGTITQPTFSVPTGSVVLSGLPATGTWVITRLPGIVTTTGSGTSRTISNLEGGVFNFTVTNSAGCTSTVSGPVTISTPGPPVVIITDPAAVCSPATVDLTAAVITEGSTSGLTFTYWTDAGATIVYPTPSAATIGTYYIKGTTVTGYFTIKPVTVTIDSRPIPNAGVDQTLDYLFNAELDATLNITETGSWSVLSGTGNFSDATNPKSSVSDLSLGENLLVWSVKNGVCPSVTDTVSIIVKNLIIPTLITPNGDGRNDYFVLKGLATLGKTELIIFDRKGVQVYKNMNYDNSWNGVDYNEKPLPEDTYFYVLKSENGKSSSGYIVIRR
jgi:gliding motility-associated-like protein